MQDIQRPTEAFVLNQQRSGNETKEFPLLGKVKPTGESGRLMVNFDLIFGIYVKGSYNVLDTDYSSYTVIYTCDTFFGYLTTEYVWILSRYPELR